MWNYTCKYSFVESGTLSSLQQTNWDWELRLSRPLNSQLSILKIENIENVDAICESPNIKVILDFTIDYCQVLLCLVLIPCVFQQLLTENIKLSQKLEIHETFDVLKVVYVFTKRFDEIFDTLF